MQEEVDLQAHTARQEVLAEEQERKREEYANLAALKQELETLEREVEVADTEYRQYRENLLRARISSALDADKVSNVSVVQPAHHATEPHQTQQKAESRVGA